MNYRLTSEKTKKKFSLKYASSLPSNERGITTKLCVISQVTNKKTSTFSFSKQKSFSKKQIPNICKEQISTRKIALHEIYKNSSNLTFYNNTRLRFKPSFIKKGSTKKLSNLVLHDVKDFAENISNKSFLLNKFTNLLMKNGEKSKSQRIVYNTLNLLKEKIKNLELN